MTPEYFLAIICLIFVIIAQLIMWWCQRNVYMKYKEQRVGVRTKWWRK